MRLAKEGTHLSLLRTWSVDSDALKMADPDQ